MFHTILFDIDGVMLSEERYFDASALTIYELLCSPSYLNVAIDTLPSFLTDVTESEIRFIRDHVFADNHVLQTMKRCGVNANWDMVYLQVAFQITELLRQLRDGGCDISPVHHFVRGGWSQEAVQRIGGWIQESEIQCEVDFASYATAFANCRAKDELFQALEQRLVELFPIGISAFSHENKLWAVGQACFQTWYLGDEYTAQNEQSGKRGFLADEVPIVPPPALARLFLLCKDKGIQIGIGTGRPSIETRVPLTNLGWWSYFTPDRVSTASDVLAAEQLVPNAIPLSKPHPFAYLRSYLATNDIQEVLSYPLPLTPEVAKGILVVGDSVADGLAANALGCQFAAVLSGLADETARAQFAALHADYFLSNVLELEQLL